MTSMAIENKSLLSKSTNNPLRPAGFQTPTRDSKSFSSGSRSSRHNSYSSDTIRFPNPMGNLFSISNRDIEQPDEFNTKLKNWHTDNFDTFYFESKKEKFLQESSLPTLKISLRGINFDFNKILRMYDMVSDSLIQELNHLRFEFTYGKTSCLNECVSITKDFFEDEKEKFKVYMDSVLRELDIYHQNLLHKDLPSLKAKALACCNERYKFFNYKNGAPQIIILHEIVFLFKKNREGWVPSFFSDGLHKNSSTGNTDSFKFTYVHDHQ